MLHIHAWNRTMKSFAIDFSGAGRRCRGEDGGSDLNKVHVRLFRIVTMNSPV
jgi:hypothetical protein